MKTLTGLPSDLLTLSFIALESGVSLRCDTILACMWCIDCGSPQCIQIPVHNALLAKGGPLTSLLISFGGFEQRSVCPPEETLR